CSGFQATKTQVGSCRTLVPTVKIPSIRSSPGSAIFRSEWEKVYFETWISAKTELCGDELFDVFSVMVTQVATENCLLLEAVLALGALKIALIQQTDLLPMEQSRSSVHYRTALSRYGNAMRTLVAVAANEDTISTILQCCIVFFCFDLLDGNHKAAHVHIHYGTRILRNFLRARCPGTDLDICANSPAPYLIDGSMVHIFQRCNSVSYVHLAPRRPCQPSEPQLDTGVDTSTTLKTILPQSFSSVKEAVRWLDLIQNALFAPVIASKQPSTLEDRWKTARGRFLEILENWAIAFRPQAAREVQAGGNNPRTREQVIATEMQWHNAYIFVYTSHYHHYPSLVEMESRFRAIVNLANLLTDRPHRVKPVIPLTISGSLLPLFVVANKCRNAEVRLAAEKAVHRLNHRVEGLWDSRAALVLIEWARRTEDAYVAQFDDSETVWTRLRGRYILFGGRQGDQPNQAVVGSQVLEDGEWVYHEETLTW
ncbi:hypothetical protein CABS01_12096, partial [Colletotrichum abscissum]|uniref:uncharacterized protein n=1 Tax=Colletotrichum abscissum TaxID=1671311 RepID=UPI0027D592EC